MPERLHQCRFDEHFQLVPPHDVTPAHFTDLQFPVRGQEQSSLQIGRFVREVKEEVFVLSPQTAARGKVRDIPSIGNQQFGPAQDVRHGC